MTNAPFAIWIDEEGTIVRPAEIAFAPRGGRDEGQDQSSLIAQLPERQRRIIEKMTTNMRDTDRYAAAVRDWAANGRASRYVLSEDEVIERSRPRPPEFGLAAAHFELAQHLHRAGFPRRGAPLPGGPSARPDELELPPRGAEPRRSLVG